MIDRYTVPFEAEPRTDWFDEHGFAAPALIPEKQSIRALSAESVVVVAGEPWIGKTHVFNQLVEDLRQRERFVGRLSLEDGDRAVEPAWWPHWKASAHEAWWFIDAVDEALHVGSASIADVLRPALALDAEMPRLHLVIFTRDDDSHAQLLSHLKPGKFEVKLRRLLPFDRSEAQRIIGDDAKFERALGHLRNPLLKGLARFQPVLRVLAHTAAPRSKADILRDALEALCSEHFGRRRERTESLSKLDAFVAASRLAAVMLLCDRTTAQLDTGGGQVPLRDVFPTQGHLRLAAERMRDSVLFRKTPDGHRFRQKFVMELLAGFGLRDVDPEAFRLVSRGNASQFPARLATLESTLRDLAAHSLADALPDMTAIEKRTLTWAAATIDSLISAVGNARWFPSQREDVLSLLNVPGVEDILDSRLADKGLTETSRDLMFRIAIACNSRGLAGRAIRIALDVDEPSDLRTTATYFATRFGGREALESLGALLRLHEKDPPLRARAHVLQSLVENGKMDALEAASLSPPPQAHLYDARAASVKAIEKHLSLMHARTLIDQWIDSSTRAIPLDEGVRDRLRKRAVGLLLDAASLEPKDTQRLAALIRLDTSHRVIGVGELWTKLKGDPSLREGLYRDLLGSQDLYRVAHALEPEDATWLMKMLGSSPDEQMLNDLYRLMRGLSPDDPRRIAIERFFESRFSEEAVRREAAWNEGEMKRLELERRFNGPNREATPPAPIADLVPQLLDGEVPASIALRRLGLICFADTPFRPDDVAGSFADLPSELQEQVVFRVRACLQEAAPAAVPAPGETRFSSHLVHESSAFRAALTFDSERSWLTPSLVDRWLPGALFALHDEVPTIVSELLNFAPEPTRDTAFRAVERHLSSPLRDGLARQLPTEIWSEGFSDRIGTLVLAGHNGTSEARSLLLRVLAMRSQGTGARYARQIILDGTFPRELRIAAADVLLALEPDDIGWRHIAPVVQLTSDVELMKGLLSDLGGDPKVDPRRLPGPLLAPLAECLWKLFPRSGDPDRLGPRWVGPDDHAREARDELLKTLIERSRDSVDAAEAVERIAAADPWFADWAAGVRASESLSAVLQTMVQEPVTPSIDEAVRVLDEATFRPIRTERDLWRLVTEILRNAVSPSIGYDVDLLYDLKRGSGKRTKASPSEGKLQAYVRRRLEDLFPRYNGLVRLESLHVREAQEKFRRRCDILVVAPLGAELGVVAVEIKWSHDPRCKSSLKTQLVDKYLLQHGRKHGVYLVGWSGTPQAPKWASHRAIHEAQREEVLAAHPDVRVVSAYLDCPWSDAPPSAPLRRVRKRREGTSRPPRR